MSNIGIAYGGNAFGVSLSTVIFITLGVFLSGMLVNINSNKNT